MGASYHWGFMWETFEAFAAVHPRATRIVLMILQKVPADILIAWRNNEKSWVFFKKLVKAIEKSELLMLDPAQNIGSLEKIKSLVLSSWAKKGLLGQKGRLDIESRPMVDLGAPIKEGARSEVTSDGRQLLLDFDWEALECGQN